MLVERPYIRCNGCGLVSYNPNDIEHRFCGRCDKFHEGPEDYELGSKNDKASQVELQAMATATKDLLSPVELALVARAMNECTVDFMHETMQHAGRRISAPMWAELMLTSARTVLVIHEIENAIRTHYAHERHEAVRRAVLDTRDPQLFGQMTQAVGQVDDQEWSRLVLRCVGVALDMADAKERPAMTYTYALLEVLPSTYADVRSRLDQAGHDEAFHNDNAIDMHGLALIPMRAPVRVEETTVKGATTMKSYRHHKGGTYTLLMVGRSSEARDELFAVYASHQTQQVWIRPWSMFNELVVWGDGVRRPRFIELSDDDPASGVSHG